MNNAPTSRTDLSRQDIHDRIRTVKRDRNFPRQWKDIALEYLRALLEDA